MRAQQSEQPQGLQWSNANISPSGQWLVQERPHGQMDTWPHRLLQGAQLAGCALELSVANSVCRWEGLLRMEMTRRKKAET